MRKYFTVFVIASFCVACCGAMAANIQVKKASSVKKQETTGIQDITSNSLLPGVIGLVTSVSELNKQQKALTAECEPSSSEIDWVNKMVMEYAKIGNQTPNEMLKAVGGSDAESCNGGSYENSVRNSIPAKSDPCIEVFNDSEAVWHNYPKASKAKYCADGMDKCSSSKEKTFSNIYSVFGAITFTEADYMADEASTYIKFVDKMEKCAPEKISQKSREAYASFIKGTIANAGQSTNTGSIMDAVGGLSGGGLGGIGSMAPSVLQFLDK